jgi:glycosyltransferase involved in cell wall biosynthesis
MGQNPEEMQVNGSPRAPAGAAWPSRPAGYAAPVKVTIVVPVHNEESTIGLVLDVIDTLDLDDLEKEVIVVDDGSTDLTMEILAARNGVRVERLPKNQGKGMALRRGFELATGEIVVVQDADLELSPANIINLVGPIRRGEADVVFGSRFAVEASHVKLNRRLANWFLTFLTNRMFGTRLTDMETAHKAFKTEYLKKFELESDSFDIEVELTAKLARSGARFMEIPSIYTPRTVDEGKKIRFSDGLHAVRRIVHFSRWRPSDDGQ